MLCSVLAFLLLELACIIVVPTAELCHEEPLPMQTGMAPGAAIDGQEVEPQEVSLIQLGMIQGRMKGMASQDENIITNHTMLASQVAANFKASHRAVGLPKPQTASFISANGLICQEGQPRAAEGALAVGKANPTGRLFDDVYVATGVTCAQRGYLIDRGVNDCYPDVSHHFKALEDIEAYQAAAGEEIDSYAQKFHQSVDTVQLMIDCTCHTKSDRVVARGSQCDALNSQPGAWVHRDPHDGKELMCEEGPFVMATLTMAILKSSLKLPMHLHDSVSATSCASLGFPVAFSHHDECLPPMHLWTRTELYTDPDVKQMQALEFDIYSGGFERYFSSRGISVNADLLFSIPECNCLPPGEARASYILQKRDVNCAAPENHSPINDWWGLSPWMSPWPPLQ